VSDITIDRLFLSDYSFFLIGFLTIKEMNAGFVLNMGLFCSDLRFKAFKAVCVGLLVNSEKVA
jgi:hypothetical protein